MRLIRPLAAFIIIIITAGILLHAEEPNPQKNTAANAKQNSAAVNDSNTDLMIFKGKKVASLTGTVFDKLINSVIPNVSHLYFNDYVSMVEALKQGKVDAVGVDLPVGKMFQGKCPELMVFPKLVLDDKLGFACRKGDPLARQAGEVIEKLRKNGTFADMEKRWFSGKDELMFIPADLEKRNDERPDKNVIKFAHDNVSVPMAYSGAGNKSTGYEVELALRIGDALNRKVELIPISFGGLLGALKSGKADMVGGAMSITEERAKSVDFAGINYQSGIALLVRQDKFGQAPVKTTPHELEFFKGKKVASLTGTVFDKLINSVIPNVSHLYFNDYVSMVEALKQGKVDAVGVDLPVGKMFQGKCPELMVFPKLVLDDKLGFACRKGDPLARQAGEVIEKLRKNGTFADMEKRWFSGKDELMFIPADLEKRNDKRPDKNVIKFAHDNVSVPMAYSGAGNKSTGYEVELALRIGDALNRKVELIPISFGGLLGALKSGKADMVGGAMSITEERAKSVDFAGINYQSGIALLIRKDSQPADPSKLTEITKIDDLAGKTVGIVTGSKFDILLKKRVAAAIPEYYTTYPDQLWALRSGKISAFVLDEPLARKMLAQHSDIYALTEPLCNDNYAFIFPKSKEALRNDFNRILEEMRNSGILKKLDEKWFSADNSVRVVADYPLNGKKKGTLLMATDASSDPFAYVQEGKLKGYEAEIAYYIAAKMGYELKFTTPDISMILAFTSSGKADMGACCISITEERKKTMLFSDPHYNGGVVILALKPQSLKNAGAKETKNDTGKDHGFIESFKISFERTFIVEDRYKLILEGLMVTIVISVAAAAAGTIMGFAVCIARRSRNPVLQLPAKAFIGAIRGTPIVVILMILYYIVFASVNINPILVAIIGFALNFAAYVSEMMRSGIEAVDKGQLEAASALGFGRFRKFWKITFPQAARYVIPVYKGEFISMVKMTSIVGYIAIQDLTKMSDIIRSRTYEAFFPLIATAIIYFVLAYILTAALGVLETRIDPKRRKRVIKGVVVQ